MNNLNNITPRQELISLYSDTHKDAYGVRPRRDLSEYTDEQLEAAINEFHTIAMKEMAEQEKWEQMKEKEFAANIERYQTEFGATDETTAIQWMLDAEDTKYYSPQDVDMFLYMNGISLYSEYGKEMSEKINNIIFGKK